MTALYWYLLTFSRLDFDAFSAGLDQTLSLRSCQEKGDVVWCSYGSRSSKQSKRYTEKVGIIFCSFISSFQPARPRTMTTTTTTTSLCNRPRRLDHPVILKNPKVRFTNMPLHTAICLRRVHTPSSLNNHSTAATGQKKPMILPHNISSSPPSSVVVVVVVVVVVASPPPPNIPPASPLLPPAAAAEEVPVALLSLASLSSHLSSRAVSESPLGMVSGVWVWAWTARNCDRSVATSAGVKPESRRRSKPRGEGVVVVVVLVAVVSLSLSM